MNQSEIISLILSLLTIILPPLIGAVVVVVQQNMAKLPANQQLVLSQVGQVVVNSVEQSSYGKLGPDQKKAIALSQFQALSKQLKLNVPDGVASAVIESSLFALRLAQSEVAKDTQAAPVTSAAIPEQTPAMEPAKEEPTPEPVAPAPLAAVAQPFADLARG